MDKHLSIKLNANRRVSGVLRGYDQFMNMVGDFREGIPLDILYYARSLLGTYDGYARQM
jgi:hypothetical protein